MKTQQEMFALDREYDERAALGDVDPRTVSRRIRTVATGPQRGRMRVLPKGGDAAPVTAEVPSGPVTRSQPALQLADFVASVARIEPDTAAVRAPGPEDLPRVQMHHQIASAVEDARRDAAAQAERAADLEARLRSALQDLGRDSTETRNLRARVRTLEPVAERVRTTDLRLEAARAEIRNARAELDIETARRQAAESAAAALRSEVDWRDYVIRDLEPISERVEESELRVARMAIEYAKELAMRDAEIERLRVLAASAGSATDGDTAAPSADSEAPTVALSSIVAAAAAASEAAPKSRPATAYV